MDTLTHALAGALVARATAPAKPGVDALPLRSRVLAGTAAAAFPDIDFVLGYLSPVVYLQWHRGITHSVLLLPLWALLLAMLFARIARDPRGYRPWFGVCALGIGTHIATDLITSFGTMILAPVSNQRFGLGTTFIIDLWLSGLVLAGLLASLAWRGSRLPAVFASLAVVGYVAMQAVAKGEAERFGEAYAQSRGIGDAEVIAHPRPVSPFNWSVFVRHHEEIAFTHVNLVRRHSLPPPGPEAGFIARLNAPYEPLDRAQWDRRMQFGTTLDERSFARSAWRAHDLRVFRWFADVPIFDGASADGSCAWFIDLRFLTPGRGALPFRYGVCRNGPDDRWQLHLFADGAAVPVAR